MHTKHANTVFPGDKVTVSRGGKTASSEKGTITGADPTSDLVKVTFSDGREEWVDRSSVSSHG